MTSRERCSMDAFSNSADRSHDAVPGRYSVWIAMRAGASGRRPFVWSTAALVAEILRLGDRLDWTLTVLRVGRSSLDLALTARVGAGDTRLEVRKTLVWIGRGGKPAAWPREMRARLEAAREHGDE